jgi:cytochrome c oxidase cbb3-type subunit 3
MGLARILSLLSLVIITGSMLFYFRTERHDRPAAVPAAALPAGAPGTALQPGGVKTFTPSGRYQETAADLSTGQTLYNAFNCVGCHQHGGGSIGPALMDGAWLYGGAPEDIYRSIAEGRPNGMPSFASHIPDSQIWQLVVYVRSLSASVSSTIQASRDDHMQKLPPQTLQEQAQ